MNKESTSVIDVPLGKSESDLLQIEAYQEALSRFIDNSNTPITLAIQGEWGSGKTSFMNKLEETLCELADSRFYSIWINAWHYSLMREPAETLVGVIKAIIDQVTNIIKKEHTDTLDKIEDVYNKTKKVSLGVMKIALKTTANTVVSGADEVVDQIFDQYGYGTISELRDELQDLIDNCIERNKKKNINKTGFLIFIDDLDRIDPPVAVTILELFKNIFDLKNCVFVLAIDYEVVVKGLKPKFGELKDENEREFRSFFDKIIQLPFQLPVRAYVIDRFLIKSLIEINFITEEQSGDQDFIDNIKKFVDLSVGSNPRSLKRLINILSLIKLIYESKIESDTEESETKTFHDGFNKEEKLITLAMVCIQITYQHIYNLIAERPNFPEWNAEFAQKLKLEKLTQDQENEIDNLEEFDEDWEKILFRACIKDPFLSRMVFKISVLMNTIKDILDNSEQTVGEVLNNILEYSSVTNVESKEQTERNINTSQILNSIHRKLHPLLVKNRKRPFNRPNKKGKRVQSVLRYNFRGKEKGKDVIALDLKTSGNKITLSVGNYFLLCDRITKDLKQDLESTGKMGLYENILSNFKQIEIDNSHPYKLEITEYTGRKEHWLYIYFNIQVDDIDEILEENFIDVLSKLITDYMQAYISIEEFRET